MPPALPRIIIATPAGQLHELGAVIINAAAAQVGWHTTYLGASLPAAEIAGAAVQSRVLAVALSSVYPEDDLQLPESSQIFGVPSAGNKDSHRGPAGSAYRETLMAIGALFTESIDEFCNQLDDLRRPTKPKPA